MALYEDDDLELEALAKRAQRKFLINSLEQNPQPESQLGLQIAAGGVDLLSRHADAALNPVETLTGIKLNRPQTTNASDQVQKLLLAKQNEKRARALEDNQSLSTIQKLIDAKREREQALQKAEDERKYKKADLGSKGYSMADDGTINMIPGGAAELANKKTLAEIAKIKAEANRPGGESPIDLEIKKARLAKLLRGENDDGSGPRDLVVPGVGEALTKEDAKVLKTAMVEKQKFDRQIQELINLRNSKGAEVLDRSAVARGKQLSKDLLLTYKNLSKLGVLSKSDEDIINAIIPSDPLEFSVGALYGKDPILTQLESFQTDLNQDFNNNVQARTAKQSPQGLKPGTIEDGHQYIGGDPGNPASWRKL